MTEDLRIKEGWATVVFLLIMLLCVAWSIQAARWTEVGLDTLQAVVVIGAGLGMILAKSRTPRGLAHSLSLLAGLTWGAFLIAHVLTRTQDLPLLSAVQELEYRIWEFLVVVAGGEASTDNLIFLLLLAWLLWWVAYFCAWAVFRRERVWWAIIIGGIALLINLSYAKTNLTVFLIGFLLSALLLVVRTTLAAYEQTWQRDGVSYSPELISSFLRAGLLLSTAAIILAWLAPKALASRPMQEVWARIDAPWRELQREWARVFHGLNYQNEPQVLYPGGLNPRTHFGTLADLSDTPVVDIQAPTGRYWRRAVFHEYTGDGWINTDTELIVLAANEEKLALPPANLRREISQTVTLHNDLGPMGLLIAAGQPLRATVPLQAAVSYIPQPEDVVRSRNEEALPLQPGDPSFLRVRQTLLAGQSYRVLSSISTADEESLRKAGTDYPDWIAPRYLHLPDSVPRRVYLLAERLTADRETPYDKAKALETYLRRFPYDEAVKGPKTGQDGVDYFLFEAQAGYCQYYASAMVVMLRAVGIPARYVEGYSTGRKEEGVYRVLESNGHAWPEVYFPGYGWIEFEPTAGEPPLNRPRSQNPPPPAGGRSSPTPRPRDLDHWIEDDINPDLLGPREIRRQSPWEATRPWLALGLLLLTLPLGLALHAVRRRRLSARRSAAEQLYGNLISWATRLFRLAPLDHQTPYEYAQAVARLVPGGRREIVRVADLFVGERFGGRKASAAEADLLWRRVRSALGRQWWATHTRRLRRPMRAK